MNRRQLLTILFVATTQGIFSQADLYRGASANAGALIRSADSLISKKAYDSAFKALGTKDDDVYLVAKKTEICLKYFVQSLNHKSFALKDFAVGDTFDKLRSGAGTFTLYPFDPAETMGKLIASGKKAPILSKALGDYYYEVSLRYQGRWTESDEEIARKAVENYEAAFSSGIRDSSTLSNYADKAVERGDFAKSVELYKLALRGDPSLPNAAFNLAYASLRLQNYQDALLYGDQAIAKYKTDPNYRMDALLLCSDAAYGALDYNRALGYLGRALEISKLEYRVYQKMAYSHLAKGDLVAADQSLDQLFALAPTNPGATQMVTAALDSFGKKDRIQKFFQRNIPQYRELPEAQGNLFFHQALDFEGTGDKTQTLRAADLARKKFLEAGKYSEQIKSALDALVARNSPIQ